MCFSTKPLRRLHSPTMTISNLQPCKRMRHHNLSTFALLTLPETCKFQSLIMRFQPLAAHSLSNPCQSTLCHWLCHPPALEVLLTHLRNWGHYQRLHTESRAKEAGHFKVVSLLTHQFRRWLRDEWEACQRTEEREKVPVYTENKKRKDDNSSEDDDEYCLVCIEPFSNSRSNEMRRQCILCMKWAHKDYTKTTCVYMPLIWSSSQLLLLFCLISLYDLFYEFRTKELISWQRVSYYVFVN